MSKLRSTVYARMEEMSFRSGVAVGAGGLAATATAITLLVTLTGHSAAAVSAAGPSAPARSAPVVSATAAPSATPSATPVIRTSPTASPASWATAAAAQVATQAAPSPVRLGLPQHRSKWTHRGGLGRPFFIFYPWGGAPGRHGYGAGVVTRRLG